MRHQTILITGGAGTIGSRLANKLVVNQNKVIILDNLSSGNKLNLITNPNLNFLFGNISDSEILGYIFNNYKIDYVFHFAAHFANQNSIDHPKDDLHTNGYGTLNLLEFSYKYNVKSFLYSSTSCIQGHITDKNTIDDYIGNLDTPYAIHKLLGEYYIRFFADYYNFKCNIVRFFNVYGPGEIPGKYRNVIPNFFLKAINNKPLTITGTGEETRSFSYVDDIIKGCEQIIQLEDIKGLTVNLGNEKETTILQLAEIINKITGNTSGTVLIPKRNWDKIDKRVANIDLAKKLIKFSPKVELKEGLTITYEWLKKIL